MLTPKQEKAIQLLIYTDMLIKDVAKEVGVHRNTITVWMKDIEFQAELKEEMNCRFGDLATQAVQRLEELMYDKNSTVALKATVEALNKAGYKEIDKIETKETVISVEVVE